MAVEADPDAVRFIAERGGRVWVYADRAGMKHVKTEEPGDSARRFEQINGYGFQLFVETALVRPTTWNVKLRRFPRPHLDILWDGGQPGGAVAPSGLYPDGPNS